MVSPSWIGLFFQIFYCLGNSVAQNDNLISTVVIFRHGDRSPQSFYPNDPYAAQASTLWPEGLSQLSKIGKQQQFALGEWLRARYDGFLPTDYHNQDISVYSADSDTCLMSAAANLAGLYPPRGEQVWNPSLPWQPIPIHTTPKKEDNMLFIGKPCPKYDKIFKELMESEHFQKEFYKEQELLDYLTLHSGKNISDLSSYTSLWDTLFVEQLYNLTLPDWTKEVFPDKMRPLDDSAWKWYTYTAEMALIRAGPLIDEIATYFEESAANTTTTQKILMFSGRDSTIADLLNSLNIFDDSSPEYASTLILELRQTDGQYFINILYKKSPDSDEVDELVLDGCLFDCNLNQFEEIVKGIRANSTTWDLSCKLDS